MLLLVKCYDNKMVKLPRGSSCRSSSMHLTNNKKKVQYLYDTLTGLVLIIANWHLERDLVGRK